MKKTFYGLGGIMIALGLMTMAGSAGDCDGKCIENANTFSEMMVLVFWGLVSIVLGAIIMFKTNDL